MIPAKPYLKGNIFKDRLQDAGVFKTCHGTWINRFLNSRYRIESELGHGGMGIVFRAYDTLLTRSVALKVLNSTSIQKDGRARLLAEARTAARLNHPNIISVFDVDDDNGVLFIVMELVEGQTLRAQMPESLEAALRIARQICAALDHAHSSGIIHRDIKTENILITKTHIAKLTDFGLAHTIDVPTRRGNFRGTLEYLCPELIKGQAASIRSDLYAFGVLLYELTAGKLPFDSTTSPVLLSQHLWAKVVPPSIHNPEIPGWLDDLIVHLLSKKPQDRPASAADVLQTLKQSSASAMMKPFRADSLAPLMILSKMNVC